MSKKKYTGELTLDAVLKAIASTMNTKANSSDITAAINNLDYTYIGAGNYVMEVSQSNGKISVIKGTLPTSLKNPKALSIGGVSYDGSADVSFEVDGGGYSHEHNHIASVHTVTYALNNLDYTYSGNGDYVTDVSQTDGKISVTKGTLPTSLKNPKALSIGGVSYDGSAAKTIAVDGTYNSSTNKIATQTTVTNALSSFSTCPFSAGTSEPSNTNLLWIDTNTSTGGLKYYNGSKWVHVPVAYT